MILKIVQKLIKIYLLLVIITLTHAYAVIPIYIICVRYILNCVVYIKNTILVIVVLLRFAQMYRTMINDLIKYIEKVLILTCINENVLSILF